MLGQQPRLATAYAAAGMRLNRPVWEVDQLALAGRAGCLAEAYRHLAGNISRTVEGLNETFDLCLVTGGGGVALYPYLQVGARKELMPEAQQANVRGYWKAGERIRREVCTNSPCPSAIRVRTGGGAVAKPRAVPKLRIELVAAPERLTREQVGRILRKLLHPPRPYLTTPSEADCNRAPNTRSHRQSRP